MTSSHWTSPSSADKRNAAPVLLDPVLVERIWGVNDLSPWHPEPPQAGPVGEIWLTADHCRVNGGPWAGKTLADITAALPREFGDPANKGFPLLIKLLFPREKLSVQVHPDDAQAKAAGMPRGKTECWYILSADPGAQVAVGFKDPLSQAQVKAVIEDGSLEDKLHRIPVKSGDMVFVDAGTVHAIGPGMVVLETQQYSDTTYRLWDYGRPRELHIEAGSAVTRTSTAAGLVSPTSMNGFTRLVACDYFAVDRFGLQEQEQGSLDHGDKLQILIALSGELSVHDNQGGSVALPRGKAVILPATGRSYAVHTLTAGEFIRVLQP